MEQIGYSLIDKDGVEVKAFGTAKGSRPAVPSPLVLPNGDAVHCATVGGTYGDWRLVPRLLDDKPPSQWHVETGRMVTFNGANTVVSVQYENSPSIVPQTVSRRQARIALHRAGLLDQVVAAVKGADMETQITWEDATEFHRGHEFVLTIGAALSLADAQIDDLFRQAAVI